MINNQRCILHSAAKCTTQSKPIKSISTSNFCEVFLVSCIQFMEQIDILRHLLAIGLLIKTIHHVSWTTQLSFRNGKLSFYIYPVHWWLVNDEYPIEIFASSTCQVYFDYTVGFHGPKVDVHVYFHTSKSLISTQEALANVWMGDNRGYITGLKHNKFLLDDLYMKSQSLAECVQQFTCLSQRWFFIFQVHNTFRNV